MATYTKLPLSGSSNGQNILVTATTSGSGVNIHTAVAGTSSLDEIYIYGYNDATASILLSLNWGSISESVSVCRTLIGPQSGRTLVIDGKLLQNGLTITAYSSVANFVTIDGFINRIS